MTTRTTTSSAAVGTRSDKEKAEAGGGAYLQIGEVAERTGVTQRTLRFYEEKGLLKPPARMDGGFRLYSEDDIRRIERIKRLRHALGVSLDEIREMVEAEEEKSQLRAETSPDLEPNERRQKLARRLAVTEQQCALIRQKSDQLHALLEEYELRRTRHAAALDALDSQIAAETAPQPTPLAGD
jgi:MerR family transcriptional regulator, repressor of the yfmOP operon